MMRVNFLFLRAADPGQIKSALESVRTEATTRRILSREGGYTTLIDRLKQG